MTLPGLQDELVAAVAAVNPRTVVVVNAGSPVGMDWAEDVAAIAQLWFPGEEGGPALAAVLFGDADPGGRLPTTIPRRSRTRPRSRAIRVSAGRVVYGESVYLGYRWYDRRRIEPRFPFGHGLSYTTFQLGTLEADRTEISASAAAAGNETLVELRVTVTNTGSRAGTDVLQCYVHDDEATVARPEQELRAFAKVALGAGQSATVTFGLDRRAFAYWDPERHDWYVEPGEFEIRIGASSRDIRVRSRSSPSRARNRGVAMRAALLTGRERTARGRRRCRHRSAAGRRSARAGVALRRLPLRSLERRRHLPVAASDRPRARGRGNGRGHRSGRDGTEAGRSRRAHPSAALRPLPVLPTRPAQHLREQHRGVHEHVQRRQHPVCRAAVRRSFAASASAGSASS